MMNRFLLTGICAAMICGQIAAGNETAAQWAGKNAAALESLRGTALADILKKGPEGFRVLTAGIKTGGASDPLAATKIAALTQYVMLHSEGRAAYAAELLKAAQSAREADVICFYLDQLRWCGLPEQAEAIRAFESSKQPGVADLAKMTEQSITRRIILRGAPGKGKETHAAALMRELAAMPPQKAQARLVKLVNDPNTDAGSLRVALEQGAKGSAASTPLWVEAFKSQTDIGRKIMLAGLLGARKDPRAAAALVTALENPDNALAEAAADALIRTDRAALIAAAPAWLKRAPAVQYPLLRNTFRRFSSAEIADMLIQAYPEASESGKRAVLEFFQERRIVAAIPHGLSAISEGNTDVAIAGYRFLREVADKTLAEQLTARALATAGRVTPEAQNALVAACRRDSTGAYRTALLTAIAKAPDAQKALALETAARLGGADLLNAVQAAIASEKAEISGAAIHALAAWEGTESLPALMRLAITGKTPRIQTLAMRGASTKLTALGTGVVAFAPAWRAVKTLAGNQENKKTLAVFFARNINVARGKKVKANVPAESDHVPQNLTDGTLEKAWYAARTPASAEIDLEKTEPISGAHITFYHQDRRTYTFLLELSADGKTWKKVGGNVAAPQPATAEGIRIEFPETPARYARLTVLKNTANPAAHVLELELFVTSK